MSVTSLLFRKQKQKRKALKTENMKTTMKKLAAGTFIAILLMVGNVQAEGTETKITSQEIESTLHVEKWMTSENLISTNMSLIAEIEQESETELGIEKWMTSSDTWNVNNNIAEEIESEMALENWMVNSETWNTFNITEETDTEITVENWMTSENIWNR